MEKDNKFMNGIKKHAKALLFLIIFTLVCFIYNINCQTINYILKRGTILEYSIGTKQAAANSVVDVIAKNIQDKKIKFFNVDTITIDEKDKLDIDKVNNYNELSKLRYYLDDTILKISLPYKLTQDKKEIVNSISEFIFEKYPNSKLIQVKTLNDIYSSPYNAFIKFLTVLLITLIIQYGILFALFDGKKLNKNLIDNIKTFFKKQKESIKNLAQNTKEKGITYLLKKIFFDEVTEEKETNYTKEIITTIFFVLVCVILIRYFIGELRWIPSGSMRPTILEHDRVFVEKMDFPKKTVERGDILVFYPPEVQLSNSFFAVLSRLSGIFCKDIAFIKRTIGLPGDKFEVKYDTSLDEYSVYINDKPLNEPYIISKKDWTPCTKQMFCGPFIIPKGHYFMMGDNRGNSQDSRFWGFLDESRIIGRANFMFFPIRRINLLRDKYIELSKEKTNNKIEKKVYIINRYN